MIIDCDMLQSFSSGFVEDETRRCNDLLQPIFAIAIYPMTIDISGTYDHRLRNTGHPVRSAIHKP